MSLYPIQPNGAMGAGAFLPPAGPMAPTAPVAPPAVMRMSPPGVVLSARPTPTGDISPRTHFLERFQQRLTQPAILPLSTGDSLWIALHPFKAARLWSTLKGNPQAAVETKSAQFKMLVRLYQALSPNRPELSENENAQKLDHLLKTGALTTTQGDDPYSTLYHLYGLLTTPRARGYDPHILLTETVDIMNNTAHITQKFDSLSEITAQQILQARQGGPGVLNRTGEMPPMHRLSWQDLNVHSNTCVPSSVMGRVVDESPKEFARIVSEATSPMQAFLEKARFEELSPENPNQALQMLKSNNIDFFVSGPGEVTVIAPVPTAAYLRAIDAQRPGQRTAIETVLQSAFAFLVTRKSYDAANDTRDAMDSTLVAIANAQSLSEPDKEALIQIIQQTPSPGVTASLLVNRLNRMPNVSPMDRQEIFTTLTEDSNGLIEFEKTLLERMMKDRGSISSVTYQVTNAHPNPPPEKMGMPYLYGYTRTFDQITQDMVTALNMGETPIIGITRPDEDGASPYGHEIRITGYFTKPENGELYFIKEDSDDNNPNPVEVPARNLIPRIHHVGYPVALANQINHQVETMGGQYFVPDASDAAKFEVVPVLDPRLQQQALTGVLGPAPVPVPAMPQPGPFPPGNYQPMPITFQPQPINAPGGFAVPPSPPPGFVMPQPLAVGM